jgi:hypothetical protein
MRRLNRVWGPTFNRIASRSEYRSPEKDDESYSQGDMPEKA